MNEPTIDDALRLMIAKGDPDISQLAVRSLTAKEPVKKQILFNRAASMFVEIATLEEEELSLVARFVNRVDEPPSATTLEEDFEALVSKAQSRVKDVLRAGRGDEPFKEDYERAKTRFECLEKMQKDFTSLCCEEQSDLNRKQEAKS